jgi:hypothetical protein
MWDKESCERVGSLVLGTGASSDGLSEAEKRRYAKTW